jgi:hypothetical protein
MKKKLKLFVWEGQGTLQDYTSGMICVLAHDLEEALNLIKIKEPHALNNFLTLEYKVIETPEAFLCWGGG